MDIDELRMVRLTWEDTAESDGTWTALGEILESGLATCQEVGWLVSADEDITIVMRSRIVEPSPDGLSEDVHIGGAYVSIPTGCVIKIEELTTV